MLTERSQRSPYINRRVEEVRQLPAEERRSSAEKLRGEIVIRNARLTRHLVKTLKTNPRITEEELKRSAYEDETLKDCVSDPQAFDSFTEQLYKQRARLEDVLAGLATSGRAKLVAEKVNIKYNETIPTLRIGHIEVPKNDFELAANYPLAATLRVAPKYFYILDARDGIGGYYSKAGISSRKVSRSEVDGSKYSMSVSCPVIVIKKGRDELGTQTHEQRHAENDVFKSTRYGSEQRKVAWARTIEFEQAQQLANDLKEGRAIKPENAEEALVYYAANQASDEITAYWQEGETAKIRDKLCKKGGTYDYFKNHLDLDETSEAYESLWRRYQELLDSRLDLVERAHTVYVDCGLHDRQEILPWVLAQYRIEDWLERKDGQGRTIPGQLEKIGFVREINTLEQISASLEEQADQKIESAWQETEGTWDVIKEETAEVLSWYRDQKTTEKVQRIFTQNPNSFCPAELEALRKEIAEESDKPYFSKKELRQLLSCAKADSKTQRIIIESKIQAASFYVLSQAWEQLDKYQREEWTIEVEMPEATVENPFSHGVRLVISPKNGPDTKITSFGILKKGIKQALH